MNIGGYNSSGGGSGNPTDPSGSDGSINPNQPCDGSGIPSQPQDPGSTLGNQPCGNGTPTLPNLSLSNPEDIIPCNKLKNLLDPVKANLKPLITNEMYPYASNDTGKSPDFASKLTKPLLKSSKGVYV